MARSVLICFILAEALMGLAMASEKVQTLVQSNSVEPPSPSLTLKLSRKFGNHQDLEVTLPLDAPVHDPSLAPCNDEEDERRKHGENGSISPSSGEEASSVHSEHRHHRSVDKSVAGGGVILGGLATMFLLAVFCYIRATGRDPKSETSSNA